MAKLKSFGHVTNKSLLLQLVDEEDMKEQALNLHSEKLAIAFGLISTSPSQPIRIVKNLRVCGDCHTVAKLISKLNDREILLRDRYRFHHLVVGIVLVWIIGEDGKSWFSRIQLKPLKVKMLDCHTNLKGTVNSLVSKAYGAARSPFIMLATRFLS
ncbi:hypothetical protein LWI28_003465 [Acer negundo]|uniref:DYW domain-containing protein n=1 Tax=Acer negundo TaxID=4023 RepID=A0AAD5P0X0_ACENE|nr:hypothetical protein LWI28_003465 [Acer negundo]